MQLTSEIRAMLAAAAYVAPSITEQTAFAAMVNRMLADGQETQEVVLAISDGISDGLRHGNWPIQKDQTGT